jgi:hypothetical protein
LIEAASLSCDLSPLSPEEDQYFTPIKLKIYHSCNAGEFPIVIDSGASVTVTPVISDVVGPLRASRLTSLQGLSVKDIVSEGTIWWSIRDAFGQVHQLQTKAYYVPDAKIRLFLPQQYFEECKKEPFVTFNKSGAKLGLTDGSTLSFPYQRDSNLPMILTNKHFNQREAHVAGLTFQEALAFSTVKSALNNVSDETNQNISYS